MKVFRTSGISIWRSLRPKSLMAKIIVSVAFLLFLNVEFNLIQRSVRNAPPKQQSVNNHPIPSLRKEQIINQTIPKTHREITLYRKKKFKQNKDSSEKLPSFSITEMAGTLTYMNLTSILQEQKRRSKLLLDRCHGNEENLSGLSNKSWAFERMTIHAESQLLYCPVLKVGSTFWRRMFHAMDTNTPIHTPYDISIQKALSTKQKNLYTEIDSKISETKKILEKDMLRMMFAREPFTRLISGYIDKIFAPNPYFWSVIGRYIIRNFRVNATEKSKKCGHDVTFPEFVKYVIYTEKTNNKARDGHFTPTYDQCKPCDIKYNVIGKMESFLNDTTFVMNNLGFNISKQLLKEWAVKAEEDAIYDSTASPFGWKAGIKKCMTMHEAGLRIWRKMQIRGIVDKHETLPFGSRKMDKVSAKEYIKALLNARNHSTHNKKQQKLEALTDAFNQISLEDKFKFRELFLPDFELFDYESSPAYIFNSSVNHKTFKTKYFDITRVFS